MGWPDTWCQICQIDYKNMDNFNIFGAHPGMHLCDTCWNNGLAEDAKLDAKLAAEKLAAEPIVVTETDNVDRQLESKPVEKDEISTT